jgi:predicted secreted protein
MVADSQGFIMKRPHFALAAWTFAVALPLAGLVAVAQQPVTQQPAAQADREAVGVEKIVTDADNGSAVTLSAGEVLVVRLNHAPSTGYSRALVSFADMPLRLVVHRILPQAPVAEGEVPVVGAARVAEWRFVAEGQAAIGRAMWLKFLHLRPFARGVETTGLWEVRVTVPPTPAAER